MAKSRQEKELIRADFAGLFNASSASIVAEYEGITTSELTELRVELRKVDAQFKVVKNRVAKKAVELEAEGSSEIVSHLTGPVGIAYMNGDVAAGTKALLEFSKKCDKFKVTGGVMDGKALSFDELKALSDLPSKDVLIAKIIGTLVSPHRGLLQVLNGVGSNLVRVINAIKDTKS